MGLWTGCQATSRLEVTTNLLGKVKLVASRSSAKGDGRQLHTVLDGQAEIKNLKFRYKEPEPSDVEF